MLENVASLGEKRNTILVQTHLDDDINIDIALPQNRNRWRYTTLNMMSAWQEEIIVWLSNDQLKQEKWVQSSQNKQNRSY
jgi:hypothetical protein